MAEVYRTKPDTRQRKEVNLRSSIRKVLKDFAAEGKLVDTKEKRRAYGHTGPLEMIWNFIAAPPSASIKDKVFERSYTSANVTAAVDIPEVESLTQKPSTAQPSAPTQVPAQAPGLRDSVPEQTPIYIKKERTIAAMGEGIEQPNAKRMKSS